MLSPVNVPSIRGFAKPRSMTPSNWPEPPTSTAPAGDPNAVMIAASTRSLSSQSRLVT
jgi:hypothetical protein